jgi:hypothetical protein
VTLLLEVSVIQETLLATVQAHPEEVVTLTVPGPPAEPADWEAGEIAYVQAAGGV